LPDNIARDVVIIKPAVLTLSCNMDAPPGLTNCMTIRLKRNLIRIVN